MSVMHLLTVAGTLVLNSQITRNIAHALRLSSL